MTGRRLVALVLVLLMVAVPWSSALAAMSKPIQPVLYTISFVASGTADGVPFDDQTITLAGVTDTDTVAALRDAADEVDPATIQKIISAVCTAAGIILFAIGIYQIIQHSKHRADGQAKILATIILDGLQILPVVRDGELVTLTVESIRDNHIEIEFNRAGKH
jgi:hypothetical protein